jgi:hypothetical protein
MIDDLVDDVIWELYFSVASDVDPLADRWS